MTKNQLWAFICAISDYQDYAPLPGAAMDADRLRMTLEDYHVLPLAVPIVQVRDLEATKAGICDKLDYLATNASADDQVFIYIAGHAAVLAGGPQPSQIDGKSTFLAPYEAKRDDLSKTCIAGELLVNRLQAIQCRQMIVILDLCRSEALVAGFSGLASGQWGARDLCVMLTSQCIQPSRDTGTGTPFMKHLCDALEGAVPSYSGEAYVDAESAYEYAAREARMDLKAMGLPQKAKRFGMGDPIVLTRPPFRIAPCRWNKALVIEDDVRWAESLRKTLGDLHYTARHLFTPVRLPEILESFTPHIAIVDLRFEGHDVTGNAAVSAAKTIAAKFPFTPILIVSQHSNDPNLAMRLARAGATDFLVKPSSPDCPSFRQLLADRIRQLSEEHAKANIEKLEQTLAGLNQEEVYQELLKPYFSKDDYCGFQTIQGNLSGESGRLLQFVREYGGGRPDVHYAWFVPQPVTIHDGVGETRPAKDVIRALKSAKELPANGVHHVPVVPHRLSLFCGGNVSSGARHRIDAELDGMVQIHDAHDLVMRLMNRGLLHRLSGIHTKARKIDIRPIVLQISTDDDPSRLTWVQALIPALIRYLSSDAPFSSSQACRQFFEDLREARHVHYGNPEVTEQHGYLSNLDRSILVVACCDSQIPWNDREKCPTEVGLFSILAGDPDQNYEVKKLMMTLFCEILEVKTPLAKLNRFTREFQNRLRGRPYQVDVADSVSVDVPMLDTEKENKHGRT